MKLKNLTIAFIAIGSSSAILPVSAAWFDKNFRNGMSNFSVGATVSPTFRQTSSEFRYLAGDSRIRDALIDQDIEETDERMRLNGVNSASVWISAYQNLTRNTSINAAVSLYANAPTQQYPSSSMVNWYYGLNLRNSKIGSIGINSGNNYSISRIGVSRTYNVLDTQSTSVSGSYTRIPNLTLSGYYAFPGSSDVRDVQDTDIHSGYGLSAAYTYTFNARHALSGAIGYTDSERHLDLRSNSVAKNKEAVAAGVSYQYQDWKLSVDAGRADEKLNGSYIDEVKTDTFGVRLDYEITPRLSTYASYGERQSKKTPRSGRQLSIETLVARNRGVNETLLFDKVKQKSYTLGMEYDLYRNVSLSGSVSGTQTKNYVLEGPFSKRDTLNYSAGVTFSF